jgi:hypothetical protein
MNSDCNTDCIFVLGKLHPVCQDYARAGEGYVIVSDGCSGSPDTDLGSRLLVLNAERILREEWNQSPEVLEGFEIDQFYDDVIYEAKSDAKGLELKEHALDATLLLAQADKTQVSLLAWGDGFFAWKEKATNATRGVRISYESGFPNYLSYELDIERKKSLGDKAIGKAEFFRIDGDKAIIESSMAVPSFFHHVLKVADVSLVAVASDGVGAFHQRVETATSKTDTTIPFEQAMADLLAFKSTYGAFVQRRVAKVLKERREKGQEVFDDLGFAAIAFD